MAVTVVSSVRGVVKERTGILERRGELDGVAARCYGFMRQPLLYASCFRGWGPGRVPLCPWCYGCDRLLVRMLDRYVISDLLMMVSRNFSVAKELICRNLPSEVRFILEEFEDL